MIGEGEKQRVIDQEHLRLLVLFYYVSAATSAFFALLPALYVVLGLFMVAVGSGAASHGDKAPPAFVGWLIAAFGLGLMALMLGFAALKFFTARAVRDRRHHTLCLVTSALSCLLIPYGTILGVSSFMVLERTSVKSLFTPPAASPPQAGVASL